MRLAFPFLFCLSAFAGTPAQLLDTAPVRFEPNASLRPAAGGVRWVARGSGFAFEFTDQATLIRAGDRTVRLTMPGSNRHAAFEAADRFAAPTHYFSGRRAVSVDAFARLWRHEVYPGIDLVYYGKGHEVEYDFEIAAGADPSRIRMRFDGADGVHLDDRGNLVLKVGQGEVRQFAPVVYQRKPSGEIVSVEARYRIDARGLVRLNLGAYNRAARLVVDPVMAYTAYLTGTGSDMAVAVGHDAQGFVYAAGNTYSLDFPATTNAYQTAEAGDLDVWVMKLDPTQPSNPIIYCSYLGGASTDTLRGMAVDANGVMYLTGSTDSSAYPVTASALNGTYNGNGTGFVSVIDPSQGTNGLIYSTFLGGSNFDEGDGIAVANGKIYVTGWTTSDDFPLVNAYQPARVSGYDAYVVELDPTQSGSASELAGTYIGGSGQDVGRAITVDSAGNVYIAGLTYSYDFPMAGNPAQGGYAGDGDAFLAKFNLNNAALLYSTFLGGSSVDEAKKIVLDANGNAAIAGYTVSPDFPATQNAYQPVQGPNGNAFLAVVNTISTQPGLGGLLYSTFYGGSGGEAAYGLAIDAWGRYYLGGYTLSSDLPVSNDALEPTSSNDGIDGFLAVIDPTQGLEGLVYGTYISGPGTQTVYGLDVNSSPSNSLITINVLGNTTSQVFFPGAQNGDPGKSTVFFFVMQANAPVPASEISEARRTAGEIRAAAPR